MNEGNRSRRSYVGRGNFGLSFAQCASSDRVASECMEAHALFPCASHSLDDAEAAEVLAMIPEKYGNGSDLLLTAAGRDVAIGMLKMVNDRVVVSICNKQQALAKIWCEAVLAPLLTEDEARFIERMNLPRHMVGIARRNLVESNLPTSAHEVELNVFLKTFDPGDAPSFLQEAFPHEPFLAPVADILIHRRALYVMSRHEESSARAADLVNRSLSSISLQNHCEHWRIRDPAGELIHVDDVTSTMLRACEPEQLRKLRGLWKPRLLVSDGTGANRRSGCGDAPLRLAGLLAAMALSAFGIKDPPFFPHDTTHRRMRDAFSGPWSVLQMHDAPPFPDPGHEHVRRAGHVLQRMALQAKGSGSVLAGVEADENARDLRSRARYERLDEY